MDEQRREDEPADTHVSLQPVPPPAEAPLVELARRARPKVVLYVYPSQAALTAGTGVARMEDVGPVTLEQVCRFLRAADADLRVQPVIDLNTEVPPVDGYEIPARLRETMRLQTPASVFPWGTGTSRRMDLDHTFPYLGPSRGGPPGQTRAGNLGPLARPEHRVRTHGGWKVRQPEPGNYLWRSPLGSTYLVTASGTQALGEGRFAAMVWRQGLAVCAAA